MSDAPYSAPVAQLFTLGEPDVDNWLDYERLGIHAEHIPELIRLVEEDPLRMELPSDDSAVFTTVHAWRALGQLKAEAAVPVLIGLFKAADEDSDEGVDDWVAEELPGVFGMIGPACIPALVTYLEKPYKEKIWGAVAASTSLLEIGQTYPETRTEIIQALSKKLEHYAENDPEMNGFIISDLAHLKAAEAGPLVERVFASGYVDEMIMGDWEDFQVAVGLLAKRTTPKEKNDFSFSPSRGLFEPGGSVRKEDKKTKAKRKQEKQSRKKNRKKKK